MLLVFELDNLPDEIILKVMSYLESREVLRCGQVSKRIRAISRDELLWQKINFANNTPVGYKEKRPTSYTSDFLEMILSNGCKYLNLHGTKISGVLKLKNPSQLRYLDLSGTRSSQRILKGILDSCYSLEKLSLSHCYLNRNYINSVCHQNGQTLKVLDLQGCKGLIPEFIQDIVKFCVELREFNFAKTSMKEESFNFIMNNITTKIEKIRLGFLTFVKDKHIKTLVTRCNKISALSLSAGYDTLTKDTFTNIIENLHDTLEELDICCHEATEEFVKEDNYLELSKLQKLKRFHCYITPARVETLKLHLPNLDIDNAHGQIIARNWPQQLGIWEIQEKQFLTRTEPEAVRLK